MNPINIIMEIVTDEVDDRISRYRFNRWQRKTEQKWDADKKQFMENFEDMKRRTAL